MCCESEMFPARLPRIRHRSELTERDWENAVQGLGKLIPSFNVLLDYFYVSLNLVAAPTVRIKFL